ncbi:MAG: YdcH family protein [Xanthomonadaceae bacterium]|nr:YdcH family protein [Xanthomonadaceae bacterium]
MSRMSLSEIIERIAELQQEHRALDIQITEMPADAIDELFVKRLKKRKLWLKDCISRLEDMLTPQEPA